MSKSVSVSNETSETLSKASAEIGWTKGHLVDRLVAVHLGGETKTAMDEAVFAAVPVLRSTVYPLPEIDMEGE